jgi:dihydroorotase
MSPFPGIFAVSAAVAVGECADLRLLDPRECVRVIGTNRDLIAGVKVRVGRNAGGALGVAPLDIALEVAEETGLPVMAHLDNPPPSRLEVLTRLRRGDILTHCFRPFPNAPVQQNGQIREEVLEARRRGVIFDIGHGRGSFGFRTTEAMLAAGFPPDVISSDVHALSIKGPAFDQLVTMSKFLCLGMELVDAIRASTVGPAAALRRTDIGRLKIGAVGDASVLELAEGNFEYRDVLGETRMGRQRLKTRAASWWRGAGGTRRRYQDPEGLRVRDGTGKTPHQNPERLDRGTAKIEKHLAALLELSNRPRSCGSPFAEGPCSNRFRSHSRAGA